MSSFWYFQFNFKITRVLTELQNFKSLAVFRTLSLVCFSFLTSIWGWISFYLSLLLLHCTSCICGYIYFISSGILFLYLFIYCFSYILSIWPSGISIRQMTSLFILYSIVLNLLLHFPFPVSLCCILSTLFSSFFVISPFSCV